ncbi:MAG TPA: CdaR family protein [Flavobacteriaceae bacterium]|nr:CdaR family protein [Flavobacteriaceae bacterium]
MPITYSTVPKDKIISKKPVYLDLKLRENGFKIAWLSLFKKDLMIDLSTLKDTGSELVYDVESNTKKIREDLGLSLEDVVFLDDILKIKYELKEVKTVPVVSVEKIEFQAGYASSDSLQIKPDSIKISGSEKMISEIKTLKTKPIVLTKVDSDISGTIPIDTAGIGKVTLYQKTVGYSLDVEKFTEGKLEVPISVVNAPENVEIAIFPKTLYVIFKVSLQNYDKISKNDFRIVCDYADLKEGQNFFIPRVVEQPENISNLRLNINKVQFVIKK